MFIKLLNATVLITFVKIILLIMFSRQADFASTPISISQLPAAFNPVKVGSWFYLPTIVQLLLLVKRKTISRSFL